MFELGWDNARLTQDVLASFAGAPPRLRTVMSALVGHVHAAVREAQVTDEEWLAAIEFLTATGQMCDGNRQEFILLSDVLGISMLVDAINRESDEEATESTVFGPFYSGEQPVLALGASILRREEEGAALSLSGRVRATSGEPVADALVEVWQTAPNGLYDVQDDSQPEGHLRASFRAGMDGGYAFDTVMPVSYPIPTDGPVGKLLDGLGRHPYRPAHVHFMISAPGFRRLVTHLFVAGDVWLESDAVFGVKPSLVIEPLRNGNGSFAAKRDFVLARVE